MFTFIKKVIKTGTQTSRYPLEPMPVDKNFRGKPEHNPQQCIGCAACVNACPSNALTVETDLKTGELAWQFNLGRCIFCGRCEEVCPMRIPIPKMLRHWREKEFERHLQPMTQRWGLGLWAWLARRPALYRKATALAARVLANQAFGKGRLKKVPLASGWTEFRDFPAPQGKTFHQLWKERRS